MSRRVPISEDELIHEGFMAPRTSSAVIKLLRDNERLRLEAIGEQYMTELERVRHQDYQRAVREYEAQQKEWDQKRRERNYNEGVRYTPTIFMPKIGQAIKQYQMETENKKRLRRIEEERERESRDMRESRDKDRELAEARLRVQEEKLADLREKRLEKRFKRPITAKDIVGPVNTRSMAAALGLSTDSDEPGGFTPLKNKRGR